MSCCACERSSSELALKKLARPGRATLSRLKYDAIWWYTYDIVYSWLQSAPRKLVNTPCSLTQYVTGEISRKNYAPETRQPFILDKLGRGAAAESAAVHCPSMKMTGNTCSGQQDCVQPNRASDTVTKTDLHLNASCS